MFTVENRVGRLIEIRIKSSFGVDDFAAFAARLGEVAGAVPGKLVGISDYRDARLLAPEVAEKMVGSLKNTNPKVERAAVLMAEKAGVIVLQAERILREANNPNRRVFRVAADAETWLAEVLSPTEQTRLHQFLAESVSG